MQNATFVVGLVCVGLCLPAGCGHPSQPQPAAQSTEPPKETRPLGSHLRVDERGVIWEDGTPVGVWGVDGGEMMGADGAFR